MSAGLRRALGLCLALAATAVAPAAPALDPRRAITQYVHDTWTIDEGLPQDGALAVLQTRDGYLWIGTEEGLARFDGVRFTVLDPSNAPGLAHGYVFDLFEDRDGDLWVATAGGLSRLHAGAFSAIGVTEGLPDARVRAVTQGPDGAIWAGTDRGLCRIEGGRAIVVTPAGGLSSHHVRRLLADGAGRLWIVTTAGLDRLEGGRVMPIGAREGLGAGVSTTYADRAGRLWVGTHEGLYRLDGDRFVPVGGEDARPVVTAIREDRAGALWIGTAHRGVWRLAGDTFERLEHGRGLEVQVVDALFEDHEGTLWFGTMSGGLHALRDGRFAMIGAPEGLPREDVDAVIEDAAGDLFLGNGSAGLVRSGHGAIRVFTAADGLPADVVTALHADGEGRLWVGGGTGLHVLRGERAAPVTASGRALPGVHALLLDRRGALWIGTIHGLYRLDAEALASGALDRVAEDTRVPAIAEATVTAIAEDAEAVWVGTQGTGLHRFAGGEARSFTTADGLSSDLVTALHVDPSGALWVGTLGGGLSRWKGERFGRVAKKDGLYDDTASAILEDDRGELWMSSNRGVYRVRRRALEDLLDGLIPGVESVGYGKADGMRSPECNGGFQPAGWKGKDGRLWFATYQGAAAVDPSDARPNALPPPVVVEALVADGRRFGTGGAASLPAGTRGFELQFTALSFRVPERVRFRYQLEGFDRGWVEAGTRRVAFYTNIPPGSYRFHVVACNDDGLWSEAGAAVTFRIEAPFYRTAPFAALTAALSIALLAALYAARVRGLRARERDLRALVAARTTDLERALGSLRDAQADLVRAERMASVASLVRGIAHELNNPIGFIAGNVGPLRRYADFLVEIARTLSDGEPRTADDVRALTRLGPGKDLAFVAGDLAALVEDMTEGARRAALIVRDLQDLTAASARGLERVDLGRAVARTLALLREGLPPGVAVTTDLEDVPPVTARAGQLEQVLVNLIDNAVKAVTPPGAVRVRLRRRGADAVEIAVEDDGAGMTEDVRRRACEPFFTTRGPGEGSGLGLAIVASIVRAHEGTLEVESEPGRGTVVTVRVPSA